MYMNKFYEKIPKLKPEDTSGMLSDMDIRAFWGKGIKIFSSEGGDLAFDLAKQLKYGSIDLRFRHEYSKIRLTPDETLTYERLKAHDYTTPGNLISGEKLRILPGEIIMTSTLEIVQLSEEFAGIVTGRSSIARMGIMVHCCQEFINPGHGQTIPLQLINLSPCVVELDLRMPVCQLVIFKLRTPASGRYKDDANSKYANEIAAQGSKAYEEIEQLSPYVRKSNRLDLKRALSKYLMPFLPTAIVSLLLAPFVAAYINNHSLADIGTVLKNMPVATILGILALFLFLWFKKDE